MMEQIRILTDSAIVVNRIAQLLDLEGIPSIVKDNIESARLGGFGTLPNDVELYVFKKNVKKAEMIINSFIIENSQR